MRMKEKEKEKNEVQELSDDRFFCCDSEVVAEIMKFQKINIDL